MESAKNVLFVGNVAHLKKSIGRRWKQRLFVGSCKKQDIY